MMRPFKIYAAISLYIINYYQQLSLYNRPLGIIPNGNIAPSNQCAPISHTPHPSPAQPQVITLFLFVSMGLISSDKYTRVISGGVCPCLLD